MSTLGSPCLRDGVGLLAKQKLTNAQRAVSLKPSTLFDTLVYRLLLKVGRFFCEPSTNYADDAT